MKYAGEAMCLVLGVVLALLPAAISPGCAATQATQGVTAPAASATDQASAETVIVEQAGGGNVSAPVNADVPIAAGWSYKSAVPVGQVALMGLMLYFSHRREVLRIKGG